MKKVLFVFIAIAIILTFSSCGSQQNTNESLVVIDSRGTEVTFDKTPEKIVSLMPSNTEILFALDCGDKLIAVSDYCNYPQETSDIPKLPSGEQLSIESIISLSPDVAIIGNMAAMADQVNQLEQAGVKVIITEANNLTDTYGIIEMLGTVMGKEKEAENIVKDMKNGFEKIKKEVENKDSQKVYVEVSPLEYGLWSCGENTFIQELINIVGAKNIFDDIEGWAAVSEEQVIARNPDVILTTSSPLTGIEDPVGEILSRENWSQIEAVKNSKVVMLDSDMISRPGPRLLDAANELVKAIYGE
ncbi:MAG: ABC transporter substrate-binding protein [Acetivibrionales bacterium]|jgi:iron complex transport system substrate-binding protein|nr:ABC transporter substrate-binding protein [Clostridiaceae bacterium]